MQLETGMLVLNLGPAKEAASAAGMESRINFGTCSNVGRVRENNEDSFGVAPEMRLFILSDGMGGMACGEVASRLTVDTILVHCRATDADPLLSPIGKRVAGVNEISNRLASGIHLANQVVYRTAQESATKRKMGATVVAARCMNNRLSIAHVGDSRAYRLRNACLEQLTEDHSFVAEQLRSGIVTAEEASASNLQHVLTRAVGVEPEIAVDLREEPVMAGDTLLLCSDGLTRELSNKQISCILQNSKDAQEAADQLVHFANEAGGGDNITVIVIRLGSPTRSGPQNVRHMSRWFSGLRNQS